MSQHEAPTRGKVLLVEDDPMIRALTVEWIEDAGFECQEAGSGEEALVSFAGADGYRAAILDVTLPDLSGPDLALELRRRRPGFPVLFATGNLNLLPDGILDETATDVLSKPYSNRELRDALTTLLGA
ncbi:response regulator [Aureimonas sp. AU4]|uniref:response regulator n=1 Tax=Aureimonas sp. AU4 TaxID=1638163 RepID=UPI0007818742|nr:response regulator [Aureimonas sp. AU4]